MAQIERLGRISEQFLVAWKCVFAWKMLRKWHKKQKKPLLGAKSLGRLFYQNNLPNMRQDSGNHTIRRFLPPSGGWVQGGCKQPTTSFFGISFLFL